jgi:hypothetical protein
MLLTCCVLSACGANLTKTGPVALAVLNKCLESHGVSNPEATMPPSKLELAIPSLVGIRGMRVPRSVTRPQFETALQHCDDGHLRVAPAPITSPVLRKRIMRLAACLARSGFVLPPPNFSGPGPVLNTSSVSIGSARWVATADGCGVTTRVGYSGPSLDELRLKQCLGEHSLEGTATNAELRRRIVELPACLRRESLDR